MRLAGGLIRQASEPPPFLLVMPDESMPLVPLPGSQLARQGSGSGRILDDMVSSTLTTSQKEGALNPRYRIGDIDFCEPDYHQIVEWAQRFDTDAANFLAALLGEGDTLIVNGRLKRLSWNMVHFPEFKLDYGDALELESLSLFDEHLGYLTPPPSTFYLSRYFERSLEKRLVPERLSSCANNELDLALDSRLEKILRADRGGNQTTLSLSCPTLRSLACHGTNIVNLECVDLRSLRELRVDRRHNTFDIDKSDFVGALNAEICPLLEGLDCSGSRLEMLDMDDFQHLLWLNCAKCGLENLWVFQIPSLQRLQCQENELRNLALVGCESLEELNCSFNHIAELDLSFNPEIRSLSCQGNMLEELDIRPLQHLETLTYDRDRTRLIQRPDQNF
jgi:hypothetical protein